MSPTEAAALLTVAASFDNRKPDADQAKAWAMVLDGLRFQDCREVILSHYRTSREWLMPADIVSGVRRNRRDRLEDATFDPPPGADPDDVEGYLRWLKSERRRIADGGEVPTPAPREADALPNRNVAELGQAGTSVEADLSHTRAEVRAAQRAARDEFRANTKPEPEPLVRPEDRLREPEPPDEPEPTPTTDPTPHMARVRAAASEGAGR